jgi:hypothetical protein
MLSSWAGVAGVTSFALSGLSLSRRSGLKGLHLDLDSVADLEIWRDRALAVLAVSYTVSSSFGEPPGHVSLILIWNALFVLLKAHRAQMVACLFLLEMVGIETFNQELTATKEGANVAVFVMAIILFVLEIFCFWKSEKANGSNSLKGYKSV